jgi:sulfur carrier protein ThiS
MQVSVKLIATYRHLLPAGTPGNTAQVEVPDGIHLGELLARFGVPLTAESVILLNGQTVALDTPLQDGDQVSAFSAVAGG